MAVSFAAGLSAATALPTDLREANSPAMPRMTVEEAYLQRRLLLIAEDENVNQLVILRQADMLGYAGEIASDGAEALRMWSTGR